MHTLNHKKNSDIFLAKIFFFHVQLWYLILKMRSRAESSSFLEDRWLDSQLPTSWKRLGPSWKDSIRQG